MIRLMLLSCAFVAVTGGLIVALLPPAEDAAPTNTVSRAQAAPLSLQPAIPVQPQPVQPQPAAIVTPEPQPVPVIEPQIKAQPAVVQIVPQTRVSAAIRPQQRPAGLVPVAAPAPVTITAPQPAPTRSLPKTAPVASSQEEVDDTLNAIGHDIVKQLMKPSAKPPAPVQQQAAIVPAPRPAPQAAPVPAKPQTVEYVVKDGDSLPGLAFRFFGTTAAYLQIVDANPILRDDPQALRAGLVIEIPNTQ